MKDSRNSFCKKCGSSKAACRCSSGGTIGLAKLGPISDTIRKLAKSKTPIVWREEKKPKRRRPKMLVQEIRMLRELAWWFFRDRKCYFCKERFIEEKLARKLKFGRRNHKPFRLKLTQHHKDENRKHNEDDNLKWCHQSCHKAHHMREMASAMQLWEVMVQIPSDRHKGFENKVIRVRALTKRKAKAAAERKGFKHVLKITLKARS